MGYLRTLARSRPSISKHGTIFTNMSEITLYYLFLISPSFGASGRLCFVIVTILGTFTLISLFFVEKEDVYDNIVCRAAFS